MWHFMRPDSLPRLWRYINLLLTYLKCLELLPANRCHCAISCTLCTVQDRLYSLHQLLDKKYTQWMTGCRCLTHVTLHCWRFIVGVTTSPGTASDAAAFWVPIGHRGFMHCRTSEFPWQQWLQLPGILPPYSLINAPEGNVRKGKCSRLLHLTPLFKESCLV